MRYSIFYVVTLIALVGIDLVWLTGMNARLYKPVLGDLLADRPNLPAAAAFYLIYTAGITLFVGVPALRAGDWPQAALFGAMFGLFCYATYDLTNQATLRNWSIQLTLMDIAWGMLLSAMSATIGVLVTRAVSSN